MRSYTVVLLGAVFLLALFLGLEPLLTYPIWGSDTGEYYYLTNYLITHGSLLRQGYSGWGFGYPDFPGVFLLGGAVAQATRSSPLLTLEIVVPFLGALATFPLFLLFRRFFNRDGVALLGAAIAAVVFPRIFILSHPVPDALGDFLALGALWMFVEQRRDVRWFAPLTLTVMALIVSHHLSSYFFLVSAAGIVTGLELLTPMRWSRRFPLREYLFLGGFTAALFAYWALYATSFSTILQEGLPRMHVSIGILSLILSGATLATLSMLALLVHMRRRFLAPARSLVHVRYPTVRKIARDMSLLALFIFGTAVILIYVPIPGTGQKIPPLDVLWFTPLLIMVPFSAGGIPISAGARLGPAPYAWLGALMLSAAVATIANTEALPVDRHAEYVVIAMSLVVAIGVGSLIGRWRLTLRGRGAAFAVLLVLVGANAIVAFPPPQVTDGFQEGFTYSDTALASWGAHSLPAGSALASDHRLSDLYFGLSGNPATWSTTCALFLGNSSECSPYHGNVAQSVLGELNSSGAPHHPRPIDAVAVDSVMVDTGVALDPSQPAYPMSTTELKFMNGPLFALLYENGQDDVWWFTGG